MSTTTTSTTHDRASLPPLTFGGIIFSEWIKLRSLRSTFWCYLLVLVFTVGFAALVAVQRADVGVQAAAGKAASSQSEIAAATNTVTVGLYFTVLIVAVLGALVITGEYGTGMIKSTFTADPGRLGAVFGKALVFGVVTFVVGFISLILAALVSTPLLSSSSGINLDWSDGTFWIALLGGAGYLALSGLLSFFLGAVVRSTAGGIAAAIGMLFVLNIVFGIVVSTTKAAWAMTIANLLPSAVAGDMFGYGTGTASIKNGVVTLDQPLGFLVMVGYVVIIGLLATVLVKRRDA